MALNADSPSTAIDFSRLKLISSKLKAWAPDSADSTISEY